MRSLTGLGFAWVSRVLVASQDSDVKLSSVTSALGSLVEEVNLFYLIYLLVYSFFIQILILITVY